MPSFIDKPKETHPTSARIAKILGVHPRKVRHDRAQPNQIIRAEKIAKEYNIRKCEFGTALRGDKGLPVIGLLGNFLPYIEHLRKLFDVPVLIPTQGDEDPWGMYQSFRIKVFFIFERDYPLTYLAHTPASFFLINCSEQFIFPSVNCPDRNLAAEIGAFLLSNTPNKFSLNVSVKLDFPEDDSPSGNVEQKNEID